MKRVLPLVIAMVFAAGAVSTPVERAVARTSSAESAETTAQGSCPDGAVEKGIYAQNQVEADYIGDLTLCDWAPQPSDHYRYSFTNESPVVWGFRDAFQQTTVPVDSTIHHDPMGIAPLFSVFITAMGISESDWILAPGETVWLSSIDRLEFGLATPVIASAWLLYKQQSSKLKSLGKQYWNRLITTRYPSKTRTFLWNCVAAGASLGPALDTDVGKDPLDFAIDWMDSAKSDRDCIRSFSDLFKKSSKPASQTSSVTKWFTTKGLDKASDFLGTIKVTREWMGSITGWVRSFRV